jgi:glycosyltransferase involved in cell wall biosynthesis
MRILVFCDEDLSASSGGDRQVFELVRHLAAPPQEICLIAPGPRGRNVELGSVTTRFVPVIRMAGLRPLSYLIGSTLAVMYSILTWRPDVLLWFDSPGQIGPGICARMTGYPYVLFVNGLPAEEMTGHWGGRPAKAILMRLLQWAAEAAAAVISVCDEIPEWMQSHWRVQADRCHVIRNGVDPTLFSPIDSREARMRLGLDLERRYVGFVGGFFPWHGLDLLLKAVPTVLSTIPDVQFLLVGDGQVKPAIEQGVLARGLGSAVCLPGRIPYQEVPLWIGACDVCIVLHVQVRTYPGDSMKLWEYMACARPIVATEGPGYGDVVEAAGCGVSVKRDNADELAEQIIRLVTHPEVCIEMGRRGRASVIDAQTWQARARRLETVLAGCRHT